MAMVNHATPDRSTTELTHVGVQRLCTGHAQDHRPEGEEREPGSPTKSIAYMGLTAANRRGLDHAQQAEHRDHDEPQQHHRAERPADLAGPETLNREQRDENRPTGSGNTQVRRSTTSTPSTADKTEIAGVIMPSP